MPVVDINIGTRGFQLVCGDGQEEHLKNLASDLSRKIDELSQSMKGSSDTLLLVMSSLMIQDELNELKSSSISPKVQNEVIDEAVTEAVNAIAEYVETIAQRIDK